MTPISPEYTREDLIVMIHQRDALVSDLKEAIQTCSAANVVPPDHVTIPKAALLWLHGEGPDRAGLWFGDCEDAKMASEGRRRPYWWRSKFRDLCGVAAEEGQ